MFGSENVSYFREVSEVDPKTQTLTAVSKNITYSHLITVEEKMVYRQDPHNATW
jgi:hypothetical protein